MLYLNNMIKDRREITGIHSCNKCTGKEIQYTVSIQLLFPLLASACFFLWAWISLFLWGWYHTPQHKGC